MSIVVNVFITNKIQQVIVDGIIGMSPCPSKLQDYVFSYQLTKKDFFGQVQTLEYNLQNQNSTTHDGMGGHISVNELNNS